MKYAKFILLCLIIILFSSTSYGKIRIGGMDPVITPFTGRLINHGSALFLQPEDFTSLENLRYYPAGVGSRLGMTAFTSNAESNGNTIYTIFPFPHENEFYLIAATRDASSTTFFQIESGAFPTESGVSLWSKAGVTSTPITHAVVRDTLIVADSPGNIWVWSGNSVFPTAILEEDTSENITNRLEWIHDGDQHTIPSGNTVYIGYSRPFDEIQTDVDDDTWDDMPSSVTPEFVGGIQRYWTKYAVTAGNSTFELPKIKTSPRLLGTHWDGQDFQYAYSALVKQNDSGNSEYQDYSLFVADSSTETYMDIGALASDGEIALGFLYQPGSVRLEFPEEFKNTVTSSVSGYYWNGTAWQVMPAFVDGTKNAALQTFSQDGWLSWNKITDWESRSYQENKYQLFWMLLRISKDTGLDDYVRIFKIKAIPYIDSPNDQNYSGVMSFGNRLVCYNGDDPSKIVISARAQPDVFVGPDAVSEIDNFRIGKREPMIAAVPIYDGALFMKESENFFLTGFNPDSFYTVSLPETSPCNAGKSAVIVHTNEGKSYAVYQGKEGVYVLTVTGDEKIYSSSIKISDDIKAYWEDGNSLKIPDAWMDKSIGWYDYLNREYHLLVASGSGVTGFNTELVWNHDKWTTFTRDNNVELSTGGFLRDENNNYLYLVGTYDGEVYEVEKGTTDGGYPIVSSFTRKKHLYHVGRSELYGVAFNYDLPDLNYLSGASLYLTSSMDTAATTVQDFLRLQGTGWIFSKFGNDSDLKTGFTHEIKLRVPGRIFLYGQYAWARPAPWVEHGSGLAGGFLIDDKGFYMLDGADGRLRD